MVCGINIIFALDLEKRGAREARSESRSRQRGLIEDHPRSPFPYHNILWDCTLRNRFELPWDIILYWNTSFKALKYYEYPLQWVTRLYLFHPTRLLLHPCPRDNNEQTRARARVNSTRLWINLQNLLGEKKTRTISVEGQTTSRSGRGPGMYEEFSYLLARLDSSFGLSNSCIYGQLVFWNAFRDHC
jgi:hypothetical protein